MMFSQQTISRADPNEIIESMVYSWWQKYVIGVNMNYIDFDHRLYPIVLFLDMIIPYM
jgi:hypothetical protein